MNDLNVTDILLVEDSDTDAEMTTRALRKAAAADKLMRVRDGVEALEFVFREGAFAGRGATEPKVIFLDIKMPRLGGIDVLKRLKSGNRTREIPVVMLTSSAEERDIVESYRLGANSYLVKPVESVAFKDMVSKAGSYWLVLNQVPGGETRSPQ